MHETKNETPEMLFETGKRFYLPTSGVADPLMALFYFNKSAEAGYVPAQRVLGVCYLEGRLTAVDYEKARHWLTEAARHNDGQAAYHLARMYIKGLGVARDWDTAFKLLDMESARNLPDGRLMKEHLKEELVRNFNDIRDGLVEIETRRRAGYDSRRQRFIQPWDTPGRPFFEKEEFAIWLNLNRGTMDRGQAKEELFAMMEKYYEQQESAYPPLE